jgi:hypothetical protein
MGGDLIGVDLIRTEVHPRSTRFGRSPPGVPRLHRDARLRHHDPGCPRVRQLRPQPCSSGVSPTPATTHVGRPWDDAVDPGVDLRQNEVHPG